MQRILVIKLADLGDLLTITPALRALRRGVPDARISALVTPSSCAVLDGSDLVDELIPFDKFAFDRKSRAPGGLSIALDLARTLRGARFDALALFHHLTTRWGRLKYAALALTSAVPIRAGLDNGHGWFLTHRAPDDGFGAMHEVNYWLSVARLLGGVIERPALELPLREEHRQWARERWTGLATSGRPTALVHPGSGAFSTARRWPADRFAEVARRLHDELGLDVTVLAGPSPGEGRLADAICAQVDGARMVSDVPTPLHLAAFLERAALVLGNDSGVIHLAAAVGRPVVAIFGPTNDRAWGPYPPDSPLHAVVAEQLACRPCIHRGHSFGTPAGCPARTCLDLIEPEAVMTAARRVLSSAPVESSARPPA